MVVAVGVTQVLCLTVVVVVSSQLILPPVILRIGISIRINLVFEQIPVCLLKYAEKSLLC